MSAPEVDHRAEAEALIRACDALRDNYATDIPWAEIQAAATLAQVHATLAADECDLAERLYRRAYAETLAERDELRAERSKLRAAVREANLHQRGPAVEKYVTLRREHWARVIELAGRES